MNGYVKAGIIVCTVIMIAGLFGGGLCCIGVGLIGIMGLLPLSKIGGRRY